MNFSLRPAFSVRAQALHRDPLPEPIPPWVPRRFLAKLLIVTAAVCAPLIAYVDAPAAEALRTVTSSTAIEFFRIVTHAGHSAIWYGVAVIGFGAAWWAGRRTGDDVCRWEWRRRARSWLFVAVSMAISGTLVNALKLAVGRYRPRFLFDQGLAGFAPFELSLDDCAFPSGHTQSIVAAMTSLGFVFPRLTPWLVATAVLVSCSRFLTTVHFVSDVIAGAAVGFAIALVMKRYFEGTGLPLAWSAPLSMGRVSQAPQSAP
jgi:membrane-associated phospholipid phosphatase